MLRVHRRMDRSEAGWVGPGLVLELLAKGVMLFVARSDVRLRRIEAHVVPAEILEIASRSAHLTETLRFHRGASGAFPSEKAGGERRERLGFSGHRCAPLLADHPAAEAA